MLNHKVGPTHFDMRLEDVSMERMKIILNGTDYLLDGFTIEVMACVTHYSYSCNSCDRGSGLIERTLIYVSILFGFNEFCDLFILSYFMMFIIRVLLLG